MEAAIGELIGQPDAHGCAAVLAYSLAHPGALDTNALARILGTCHFASRSLAIDAARVLALLLSDGTGTPSIPPITDMLSDDEFVNLIAAARERTGAPGALIAELRRRAAPSFIRTAMLAPCEDLAGALDKLMLKLAAMCRFDRTGDQFLLIAVRGLLPASVVSLLAIDETPYASCKLGLPDANEVVGCLFRTAPMDLLMLHINDPISATRLGLMMAIATEYLPQLKAHIPFYMNSDIGPATERPALFMCSNFDCGAGDTITLACDAPATYTCASSAVVAWARTDPRAYELWLAISNPGALDPTGVFARMMA
jgi:hypothetical protein